MRGDMAERFSEPRCSPRKGKFPRSHKKVSKTDEDGQPPSFKGMGMVHLAAEDYYYSSGDSRDYSLLRRFLLSKCGLLWNDVYSEICAVADDRTWDGHSFRESVDHIVCKDAEIIDGVVYDRKRNYPLGIWRGGFYVEPDTGLLRDVPIKRYKNKAVYPKNAVLELDGELYHKHEGLWYRVKMSPVKITKTSGVIWSLPEFNDVFNVKAGYDYYHALPMKYGKSPEGGAWYAESKESASTREINKLKKKYGDVL